MRSVDSSFCFDLLRKDPGAVRRSQQLDETADHLTIAAPALLEVLEAGYRRGGRHLQTVQELVSRFEVLEVTAEVANEGARMGAECAERGDTVPHMDLLIAAAVKLSGQVLITRDRDFGRIAGLTTETY